MRAEHALITSVTVRHSHSHRGKQLQLYRLCIAHMHDMQSMFRMQARVRTRKGIANARAREQRDVRGMTVARAMCLSGGVIATRVET